MRGLYMVPAVNVSASAAQTLAFVNPGATASLSFRRAWVSQNGVTASAMQRVQISSQVTAFPTLTSQAPVSSASLAGASLIIGGTAGAAGTSGINASAEGAGAKTILVPDTFNVLSGYLWTPTPDEILEWSAGVASGIGLYLAATPGTTTGFSAGLTFREH